MQNLTTTQKRFLTMMESGKEFSKCGYKIYVHNTLGITQEFKMSMNNYDRLINEGFIEIQHGGRLKLIKQLNESQTLANTKKSYRKKSTKKQSRAVVSHN